MLCKGCGQQVRLFDQFSNPLHCNAESAIPPPGQGRSTARVIVKNTSLFFLESSTIWLIWKSVPVHSIASVGKSKKTGKQEQYNM